jgi:signal transduction histidine kinase
MFELRPAVLHDYGVVAAARVLLDETARETGARAQLDGEVGRYHLVLEEAVYRGVREALANVRKHSGASTISVTFSEENGRLVCDVVDDGRGFDPDEARARPRSALHMGLPSVVERVRAADGDVSISSRPGAGTHVRIEIPIERRRPLAAATT